MRIYRNLEGPSHTGRESPKSAPERPEEERDVRPAPLAPPLSTRLKYSVGKKHIKINDS